MPGMMPQPQPAMQRYSAVDYDGEEYEFVDTDEDSSMSEQYAALAESQGRVMAKLSEVVSRNAALEARAADADRRTSLGELHNQFPHMVDLDAEYRRCLYSAGSQMDDDAFIEHCELIEQYASRVPVSSAMVPTGEMPAQNRRTVQTEKYEARVQARSTEIYQAGLEAGNIKTADQCWEEAEREIGAA